MISDWPAFLMSLVIAISQQPGDRAKKHPPKINEPASEERIATLEERVGHKLPADYKAFLRASDGFTNFVGRGGVMNTAELLEEFDQSKGYESYAELLRKKLLFDDEIGFGLDLSQVLLIIQWGGSPTAIFLVVDPKSGSYGRVIEYAPNQKRELDSFSSYMEESLQFFEARKRKVH